MEKDFIQLVKGGYGFRYFFNAGINPDTCVCDEEGIDVFAADAQANWHHIASIPTSKTIQDLEDMTEDELDEFLTENGIF